MSGQFPTCPGRGWLGVSIGVKRSLNSSNTFEVAHPKPARECIDAGALAIRLGALGGVNLRGYVAPAGHDIQGVCSDVDHGYGVGGVHLLSPLVCVFRCR